MASPKAVGRVCGGRQVGQHSTALWLQLEEQQGRGVRKKSESELRKKAREVAAVTAQAALCVWQAGAM